MNKRLALLVIATTIIFTAGCQSFVLKTVVKTVDPYFHGSDIDGTQFDKVAENIYTFRWNWYRNLVIETEVGLVVIDPMNPEMSTALKKELDRNFPGQKVHTLIYSHYHLDHTRGGAALSPEHIIAHEKSPVYWGAIEHSNLLEPTRYISGNTVLNIGGIEIRALYLGLSHTDTLYAFHIPSKRLVFTADLGLVRTVSPVGVPDRYVPGYLTAMNRIIDIDFDIFIPSHFGYGSKQDLIDWRDMLEEGRRLAREAIREFGTPGVNSNQMGRYFDAIYYPMHEEYGEWHGFNDMFVLNMVRDVVGEALGY